MPLKQNNYVLSTAIQNLFLVCISTHPVLSNETEVVNTEMDQTENGYWRSDPT